MKPSGFKVCVVIVSFNRLECLGPCLAALEKAVSRTDAILVIDNYSDDRGTLQELIDRYPGVEWIFNSENRGFTGANHQGSKWALDHGYDYIFFLNPDTRISPEAIINMVAASKKRDDRWILGPLLLRAEPEDDPVIDSAGLTIDRFYRAKDIFQGIKVSQVLFPDEITQVDGVCGAAMLIPACLFPLRPESDTAVFVESYFAYFEDAEFSLYWRKQGGRFGIAPDAVCFHQRGDQSRLRRITWQQWKTNRFIIEKMFNNRYETIIRHEITGSFLKKAPALLLYDLIRTVIILFSKPWLLPLIAGNWRRLFRHFFLRGQCESSIYD